MIRVFGWNEIQFIILSVRWTILLTLLALVLGGLLGFAVALGRVSLWAPLRTACLLYIQTIQGIPVLMLLLLSYYGLPLAGLELPPLLAASVSMGLYASGYLGEIWRGAIQAVPWQQWESSTSLAMRRWQQYVYVILPQAVRIAIPPTVGFVVQLVKNTSIVSVVGLVELARAGQLVNNATFQPFRVFGVVAALYFAVCWPLSRLSQRLERRLRVGRPG
jgi:polar amino acid transport system permease protein